MKKLFIRELQKAKPDRKLDLSIIIVSFNVKDLLRGCLESVYVQTKGISFEVFVVDNASSDESAEMVEKEFPRVKLIKNKVNLGFARANNIAIRQSQGRYILLLNPDTVVLEAALQKMVAFMDKSPEAGAVGPKILNSDGSIQYFHHSEDTYSYSYLLCWFCSHFRILNSKYIKARMEQYRLADRYTSPARIGYLSGACLMFSRKILNGERGLLDESFFMFSEDRDICLRIRKRGYGVYLLPGVSIVHIFGKSYNANPISYRMLNTALQSQFVFYKKHFGLSRAYAYRCIVTLVNLRNLMALVTKKMLIYLKSFEMPTPLEGDIMKCAIGVLWGLNFSLFKVKDES